MAITVTTEKQFESDIESFLISDKGGYTKGNGTYDPKLGVYLDKLFSFIKRTQPREWAEESACIFVKFIAFSYKIMHTIMVKKYVNALMEKCFYKD